VIQQHRDVVILMNVFAHPPTIPPQGAGNLPIVIEHTRQRWPMNFTAYLLAGILAYCLFPNQPK
jgi:hypothetical protein